MSKKNNSYKRLSFEERMIILASIYKGFSISKIASMMHRSKSTISRELSRNSITKKGSTSFKCSNIDKLIVCNKCPKKSYCSLQKKFYDCEKAETNAKIRNQVSRSIPKLPKEAIKVIDDIVSDGVKLGQSLHHIYISNPVLQTICAERTIRRLCYDEHLSVRPHQLRRYVTYKHSYIEDSKKALKLKDFTKVIGRTYKDYLEYSNKHKRLTVVQFDSVIGERTDKKAILTLTWKEYNFQMGILIDKSNPESVNHHLKKLFKRFTNDEIRKLFQVCICDNGIEFSRFYDLEEDENHERRLRTFYTRPYRSTDKAECERNHEFIRYFYPKGHTLDEITQEELNDMFSNINSYVRASKDNKTPYELMIKRFGKDLVNKLDIYKVAKTKVRLKR